MRIKYLIRIRLSITQLTLQIFHCVNTRNLRQIILSLLLSSLFLSNSRKPFGSSCWACTCVTIDHIEHYAEKLEQIVIKIVNGNRFLILSNPYDVTQQKEMC